MRETADDRTLNDLARGPLPVLLPAPAAPSPPTGSPLLDDLVALAAHRLGAAIAQIDLARTGDAIAGLTAGDRRWRRFAAGVPATETVTAELDFFAGLILARDRAILVADARLDAGFTPPGGPAGAKTLRSYAGAPIRTVDGITLGTLCVADSVARDFDAADSEALADLAARIASRLELHASATDLRDSEDHFRHAIELNPQLLWTASGAGVVDEANRRWRSLVGHGDGEIQDGKIGGEAIGDGWARAVHPDDLARTFAAWAVCLKTGEHLDHEYRLRLADGEYRWFRARAVPRRADGARGEVGRGEVGRILRWYGSLEDIHDAKLGLEALRDSEQRVRFALEVGRLGAWDLDLGSGRLTASDIFAACFGFSRGDMITQPRMLLDAVHPDDQARYQAAFDRCVATGHALEIEYRTVWPDGGTHWIRSTGRAILDGNKIPVRLIGLVSDITDQRRDEDARRAAEAMTAHAATHDALTGLANRRLLNDRLEQALADASPENQVALMSIDLDRFKAVNDTMGHGAGDTVLRHAAERLKNCARENDVVARYGGDEFVVLYIGFASRADVHAMALRVLEALSEPFEVEGQAVSLGGSVGIAVAPDDAREAAALWRNADTALYRSKRNGRGVHQFFDPALDAKPQSRHALNLSLRDALGRNQFDLVYQPMVTLASGQSDCFEALLRWQSPEHGDVAPAEFIPLAEKTGWIVPIGRWAIREACRAAAGWPGGLRVAVNLSAVQFNAGGLEEAISAALAESGLPAERLELEVTETLLLHDNKAHLQVLEALQRMGVRIALDDFGTGYSSLSYLTKFRFDMIKINEALVSSLPGRNGEEEIVRAIAGLGRSLGTAITAEGVETRGQLELVRAQGCTQAQGRLLCPPLPGGAVGALQGHVWLENYAI